MDNKEIKQRSEKELLALAKELREKLRVLRFEVSAEAVKDVREIREAKKTIARSLTELKARAAAPKPAPAAPAQEK